LLEAKTEIRMVGHILERECIFKLSEVLEDTDVEVMHCEVSFAALKAGIEEKMPSIMRFYLVGEKKERKKAVQIIKKLAKELDCKIEYIKERV
jgi:ACT domain-containing protein